MRNNIGKLVIIGVGVAILSSGAYWLVNTKAPLSHEAVERSQPYQIMTEEQLSSLLKDQSNLNPQDQFIVAMLYFNGEGIQKDITQAEKFLVQAANADNVSALYNLGFFRYHGQLIDSDNDPKGTQSLFKAAELGSDEAAILLMKILLEDESNEFSLDAQKIYTYLERAYYDEDPFVGFLLGSFWMVADRYGYSEPDYKKAESLFLKGASKNHPFAELGLYRLYAQGGYGINANTELSKKYGERLWGQVGVVQRLETSLYRPYSVYGFVPRAEQKAVVDGLMMAAKNGSALAAIELSNRYEYGDGVQQDSQKAITVLEALKDSSDPALLFHLGVKKALNSGFGVDYRLSAGQPYLKQSADQGYLPAIVWLSKAENYGRYPDETSILFYEKEAAKLGDIESLHLVLSRLFYERNEAIRLKDNSLYEGRSQTEIDAELPEWIQLFENSAMMNPESYRYAYTIYSKGLGTEVNETKAFEALQKLVEFFPQEYEPHILLGKMLLEGKGIPVDYQAAVQLLAGYELEQSIETIEALIQLALLTNGLEEYPKLQAQLLGLIPTDDDTHSVMDRLLQTLEAKIPTAPDRWGQTISNSEYAYLLGDRYFEKYQNAENGDQQKYLELSIYYYDLSFGKNVDANKHYLNMLVQLLAQSTDRKTIDQAYLSITGLYRGLVRMQPDLQWGEDVIEVFLAQLFINPYLQEWLEETEESNVAAMPAMQSLFSEKAKNGANYANYYVGKVKLANQDYKNGYALIKQAADDNFIVAIRLLGRLYRENNLNLIDALGGEAKDSIAWYEKGAALGDDDSLYQLMRIYQQGLLNVGANTIFGENDQKAYEYYKKIKNPKRISFISSTLNDVKENLAILQNIQEGIKNNDPVAMRRYAYRLLDAGKNYDADPKEGMKYLVKAADLGDASAMKSYYDLLIEDYNIKGADLERFNRYHEILAKNDDFILDQLARRYLLGDRVPENRTKARELYQSVQRGCSSCAQQMDRFDQNLSLAKQNNSEGIKAVIEAYESGRGVKWDPVQAAEWTLKLAQSGDVKAIENYGVMLQYGLYDPLTGKVLAKPDQKSASQWFMKLSQSHPEFAAAKKAEYETIYLPASKGNADAMFQQGEITAKVGDKYGTNDARRSAYLREAQNWYQKAIDAGYQQAYLPMIKLMSEDNDRTVYIQNVISQPLESSAVLPIIGFIIDQNLLYKNAEMVRSVLNQLENIVENPQTSDDLMEQAVEYLLPLYFNGIRKLNSYNQYYIYDPNPVKFTALYEKYSSKFPKIKYIGAKLLLQKSSKGIQPLEELFNDGYASAGAILYYYYSGGYAMYGSRLPKLTEKERFDKMNYWLQGYLDKSDGENLDDSEKRIEQITKSQLSREMGNMWYEGKYGYSQDIDIAKSWYLRAFGYLPTDTTASRLYKIILAEYEQKPSDDLLQKLYFYSLFIKESVDQSIFESLTDDVKSQILSEVKSIKQEHEPSGRFGG